MAEIEKLFGTDGIRGKAGEYPLTKEKIHEVTKAIAIQFAKPGETFYLGRDTRESSDWIAETVKETIIGMGRNVTDIGQVSSPGLSYLVSKSDAKAAIMITASHNPYEDNGIKVFASDGRKLHDTIERAIEEKVSAGILEYDGQSGSVQNAYQLVQEYIQYVSEPFEGLLQGKRIGLDMANGATVGIADVVLRQTGAELYVIADQPNGTNINDGVGATDTKRLQQLVLDEQLDAGIALDGDGDRVVLIDNMGNEFNGDNLLHILALDRNDKTVVATQMSNLGLENALKDNGIKLLRTAVGDRYVLEAMLEGGHALGGEQSGHIIQLDKMPSGDGLLAGLTVLVVVQQSDRSLNEWHDALHLMPQILENIRLEDRAVLARVDLESLQDEFSRELGSKGRVLIRPSGTEPLVRVMVEAPNAENLIEVYMNKVSRALEQTV